MRAAIANDPDEMKMIMDWDNATIELPQLAPFPIARLLSQT